MEPPAVGELSGTAGEEVPGGFCLLPFQDFLVWDSWIAWEQELRWAQHEWDKSLAFLAMRLPPQLMMAEQLTMEEQAQDKIWKVSRVHRSLQSHLLFPYFSLYHSTVIDKQCFSFFIILKL